ncbi:MAG TPA: alpha/beta hydrolase [Terriglobales bacterium]|nr:alpha/beta hydrolase [Terriglobales bacterium]
MTTFAAPTLVTVGKSKDGSDIRLSVHQQGQGPAVVFCHGFPELGFSWRHQLSAVAAAGFRAIAPDQRGYGASSAPAAIDEYGLTELTGDLCGMLDQLGIERAVFVGHDWGGFVAWAMPVLHPQRTAGVVGICTPYLAFPSLDLMRMMVGGEDERFYILWFQPPGQAEAVMDPQAELLFERLLRGGVPIEQMMTRAFVGGKLDMNPFRRLNELEGLGELIVTEDELAHYSEVFRRTGFRGGINWYRNIERNNREHPAIGTQKLELPCLMITAEWDAALRPEMAAGMPALCRDLEMKMIPKAGHWVQQELPAELNAILIDWLQRRFR